MEKLQFQLCLIYKCDKNYDSDHSLRQDSITFFIYKMYLRDDSGCLLGFTELLTTSLDKKDNLFIQYNC